MELLFLVVLLVLVVLWKLTQPLYWRKRGVPCLIPLPLFGNGLPSLWLSSFAYQKYLYDLSYGKPYLGIFLFSRPALLLRDPQIIMEVLVGRAPSFSSHGMSLNNDIDSMSGSVFHLRGQEWKNTRAKLSHSFSPVKIKSLLRDSIPSVESLSDWLRPRKGTAESRELHGASLRMSVDLTARALFGVQSEVFTHEGRAGPFLRAAEDVNTPQSMLKAMLSFVCPPMLDLFQLYSFSEFTENFIRAVVDTSVSSSRAILPNILSNSPELGKRWAWSQGAVLWAGGVETTANTLSFALYELALNEEIQEKLRASILGAQDGAASLVKQVIEETLRKYPVFPMLTREATSDCTLNCGLRVEKGTLMVIPVYCLQNDDDNYSRPEKFTPGRVLGRGTYLPFGAGPRTCLGMRLAESILADALRTLIVKYRFSPCSRTQIPLQLKPKSFFTTPSSGIWLKVEETFTEYYQTTTV